MQEDGAHGSQNDEGDTWEHRGQKGIPMGSTAANEENASLLQCTDYNGEPVQWLPVSPLT